MPPHNEWYYLSGLHLWRTVIYRAMQEAQGRQIAITVAHTPLQRVRRQRQLQRDAIRWLTKNTPQLRIAFERAMLPMKYSEFLEMTNRRFYGLRNE